MAEQAVKRKATPSSKACAARQQGRAMSMSWLLCSASNPGKLMAAASIRVTKGVCMGSAFFALLHMYVCASLIEHMYPAAPQFALLWG